MIPLTELLVPTGLAAVLIFIASGLIHMVLKYHNPDYRKLPNEDEVAAAIRKGGAAPAQYVVPHCAGEKDMKTPEMKQKYEAGPVALIWLMPNGCPNMGKLLSRWFVYCLVVSFFVAYVASHTVLRGAPYLTVFRVVGAVAFLAYSSAHWSNSIWMGKPVKVSVKDTVDGLIYGLLTAGAFAGLWPK